MRRFPSRNARLTMQGSLTAGMAMIIVSAIAQSLLRGACKIVGRMLAKAIRHWGCHRDGGISCEVPPYAGYSAVALQDTQAPRG